MPRLNLHPRARAETGNQTHVCLRITTPIGAYQMAVKVMIPTPLRVYTGKRDSTEVSAGTVGEALSGLTTQFGDLRKHLFTEDGKLRSFVNVYVNDEDIRYLAKDATPTKDGDTISIAPSIAGGCAPTCCC